MMPASNVGLDSKIRLTREIQAAVMKGDTKKEAALRKQLQNLNKKTNK